MNFDVLEHNVKFMLSSLTCSLLSPLKTRHYQKIDSQKNSEIGFPALFASNRRKSIKLKLHRVINFSVIAILWSWLKLHGLETISPFQSCQGTPWGRREQGFSNPYRSHHPIHRLQRPRFRRLLLPSGKASLHSSPNVPRDCQIPPGQLASAVHGDPRSGRHQFLLLLVCGRDLFAKYVAVAAKRQGQ